jgi:hypothetical protein
MPDDCRTFRIERLDEAVIDILKGKSAADCIAMTGEAHETAQVLAAAGIRHLHPEWSEDQVRAEVARRMLS